MKRILLLLTLFIIVTSCQQDDTEEGLKTQTQNFESSELKNSNINDISIRYSKTKFLKGDFEYFETKDKVIFSTNTEQFKHVFILDIKEGNRLTFSKNIKYVYYLKDALVINKEIVLEVDGNSSKALKEDLNTLIETKSPKYYKLNNLRYLWVNKTDSLSTKEILSYTTKQHKSSCEAGGQGSTSCSITSNTGAGCSTSCGTGYYACCNETLIGPNDCHCEPIQEHIK